MAGAVVCGGLLILLLVLVLVLVLEVEVGVEVEVDVVLVCVRCMVSECRAWSATKTRCMLLHVEKCDSYSLFAGSDDLASLDSLACLGGLDGLVDTLGHCLDHSATHNTCAWFLTCRGRGRCRGRHS